MCLLVVSLSLLHLVFGTSRWATPLLYLGLPTTLALVLVLLVVRSLVVGRRMKLCRDVRDVRVPGNRMVGPHRWLLAALALTGLAAVLQDPNTLGLCDPDGAWYTMTHGYWHLLLALAVLSAWWFLWSEREVPYRASECGDDDGNDAELSELRVAMVPKVPGPDPGQHRPGDRRGGDGETAGVALGGEGFT